MSLEWSSTSLTLGSFSFSSNRSILPNSTKIPDETSGFFKVVRIESKNGKKWNKMGKICSATTTWSWAGKRLSRCSRIFVRFGPCKNFFATAPPSACNNQIKTGALARKRSRFWWFSVTARTTDLVIASADKRLVHSFSCNNRIVHVPKVQ